MSTIVSSWLSLALLAPSAAAQSPAAQSPAASGAAARSGEAPQQAPTEPQGGPPTELPRIDPLSPAEALGSFEVADGFRIELVAAEPLVIDPVAFCFDAQGRLLVVEMRGYSERPDDALGRVRRLTDVDGDGRMDEVETIIDTLAWPTAIAVWNGGVVIAAAPDLIYLPEGYVPGEPPQVLASGFGRSNVQGLVNSLRWGLDLRLHGATSSSGAELQTSNGDSPLRLGRRDFAISFPAGQLEPTEGGGQHGMMIDPWGDKYVCSNSDHLQQVMLLRSEAGRADRTTEVPPLRRSIAADGPQADVFRSSPVEPWRILRTHLRVTGQVPGPIEGGGRAAGYFTGATGVYVYDGDQWPSTAEPTALVCDVGSNLVHRKRLMPDGLWNQGFRIDPQTEFVRSSDIWFRPVQLGTGPDGALYIADMYRETIEHPLSLPPAIKSQLDLNSGNDRGRIWRVVSTAEPLRREPTDLHALDIADLVALVDHPNAWHRRTAARLLSERNSATAIAPLRELVRAGHRAEGRVQALALLMKLDGGLDRRTLDAALADSHPRVRQRAVEAAAVDDELLPLDDAQVETLSRDPSIFVRFQLAYDAVRSVRDPQRRASVLSEIARQDVSDPWVRWAVEGSLGDSVFAFAERLSEASEDWEPSVRSLWWRSAIFQLATSDDPRAVPTLVQVLGDEPPAEVWTTVADALSTIPPQGRGEPLAKWVLQTRTDSYTKAALLARGDDDAITPALRLLRWASAERGNRLLEELLAPDVPPALQQRALTALVGNDEGSVQTVLTAFERLTPAIQDAAAFALVGQRQGFQELVAAVTSGQIALGALPEDVQRQMREHPDASLRLPESFQSAPPEPVVQAEQMAQYVAALGSGVPDPLAGQAVYRRVCASCHRVGTEGTAVGPDLKSLVDKSPDQILLSILEPNREVDPKYRVVLVETEAGQLLAGIVASESSNQLGLIDSQGKPAVVAREEIADLRTQNRSLMPEGLQKEIGTEAMRDLIHFLKQASGESK